jgi:hypothetical protein
MPRATTWITVIAVLWAVAFTVRVEETRLARERERTGAALLAASNLAASRDSTRKVARTNARVARVLGDSLMLVEKRVQQVSQRADALDRALGRERLARFTAVGILDSLRRVAASAVDTGTDIHSRGVRLATFSLRSPPYTVGADVVMPPPPDSARIQIQIALDPIPIEVRVSCAAADPGGIRDATVSVSTPTWAAVRLGTVEQSPGVCPSPALAPRKTNRSLLGLRRLIIGAGTSLAIDGRWRWAVFVGSGFAVFS